MYLTRNNSCQDQCCFICVHMGDRSLLSTSQWTCVMASLFMARGLWAGGGGEKCLWIQTLQRMWAASVCLCCPCQSIKSDPYISLSLKAFNELHIHCFKKHTWMYLWAEKNLLGLGFHATKNLVIGSNLKHWWNLLNKVGVCLLKDCRIPSCRELLIGR